VSEIESEREMFYSGVREREREREIFYSCACMLLDHCACVRAHA